MTPNCPEYPKCLDRRASDAEHKGKIEAKLEEISNNIKGIWSAMEVNRTDIKQLYYRIGLIAGSVSLIVSLVVKYAAR